MNAHRDPVIGSALDHLAIPEHHDAFWDDFFSDLHRLDTVHPPGDAGRLPVADAPAGAGSDQLAPVVSLDELRPTPPDERRVSWRVLAGVAASIIVLAVTVGIGHLQSTAPSAPVVADQTPTASDGGTGSVAPTTTGVPPVDAAGQDEAAQRVLGFLDALGRGDTATAASFVGPISEQRAEAAGGMDSMLTTSTEGLGAWAAADPALSPFAVAPGLVVVVLEGDLDVEGTTEHRVTAIPVRKAESVGAWFVEPWAYDLAGDPPVQIVVPDIDAQGRATLGTGDERVVEASTPASGTAWLTTSGGVRASVDVAATGGSATWRLMPTTGIVVVTYVDGPVLAARSFRVTGR